MAIDINIPSQVKNYTNLAAFPALGALKTIYIAEDTNKTYRWTGTAYVEISATAASTWGAIGGTLSNQTDLQTALNGKVDTNATITGATKTKVTYDSKGLVTSGADATTADIADSTNKRYVTDANLTVINNTSGTNTGDQTLSGLGGVPTSRTLTINGTTQDLSADRTFTISTGITIGTTAITSGTVGRVLFEGTGNVVSESANLFWDNTNGRLGIGTSSPSFGLDVNSTARVLNTFQVGGGSTAGRIELSRANVSPSGYIYMSGNNMIIESASQGLHFFASGAERMRLVQTTGNLLVGTTTDAGYKLDVNGTVRVQNYGIINRTSNANDATIVFNPSGTLSASNLQYQMGLFGNQSNLYIAYNNGSSTQTIFRYIQSTNVSEYLTSLTTTGYIAASSSAYFASNASTEVIIGSSSSINSAILNVASTTRGFLPPRMTTTQKNAIASPATGLMVYDTTLNLMSVYNGTTWITL